MLTRNDLTAEHIQRIKTELDRDPIVWSRDNIIRIENVDYYEQWTHVYWPGTISAHVWRERSIWYWTVKHLWRDETLLAEGTARTKQDAVDDMVDALIEHAREGASRRDVFREWMERT